VLVERTPSGILVPTAQLSARLAVRHVTRWQKDPHLACLPHFTGLIRRLGAETPEKIRAYVTLDGAARILGYHQPGELPSGIWPGSRQKNRSALGDGARIDREASACRQGDPQRPERARNIRRKFTKKHEARILL
jgi:hypothetical protein